jgi:hypothetical protein
MGACLAILPCPFTVGSGLSPSHLRPKQGICSDSIAHRHREPVTSLIPVIGHLVPLVGRLITLIGRLITHPSGVITLIGGCVSPITSPIPLVTAPIPLVTAPIPPVANLITQIRSCVSPITSLVPLRADHIPARRSIVTLIGAGLPLAGRFVSPLHRRAVAPHAPDNLPIELRSKNVTAKRDLDGDCDAVFAALDSSLALPAPRSVRLECQRRRFGGGSP